MRCIIFALAGANSDGLMIQAFPAAKAEMKGLMVTSGRVTLSMTLSGIQWKIPCSDHQDHSFGLGLDVARGRLQRQWGGHLLRRGPLLQIANGVTQILFRTLIS